MNGYVEWIFKKKSIAIIDYDDDHWTEPIDRIDYF